MKASIFKIKQSFAKYNKLPQLFKGVILRETNKAYYIYGHGTMETRKTGQCCVCGRTLTHPVSVELGIGPHCGQHWWDWNLIGGFNEENIERLKREMAVLMENMKVDTWMPKSVVEETISSEEDITTPSDHKMLQKKEEKKQEKEAILVKFQSSGEIALRILFPFDYKTVDMVKTLENRKYNPTHKYWTCSVTEENVRKLRENQFKVDDRVSTYLEQLNVNIDALDASTVEIPELGMELFPFQKKGVAFLEAKNGRALIADEMGLGKTAQALAWLQLRKEIRPVLIIVPASLKLNWEREAQMWMNNPKVTILQGTKPHPLPSAGLVIINYDILSGWESALKQHHFKCIIADEVHYARNNSAERTKVLKRLVKTTPHFIGLSGTPIVNRPVEFYNAIKMIDPNLFPSFWSYSEKYCDRKHNGFGWDFSGASNTEELHEKLTSTIMIRRKKEDVLTELPDKIRSFIPIPLDNREEYNQAEANFIDYLKRTKGEAAAEKASGAEVLSSIEGLKQLSVDGKLPYVTDWVRDFINNEGKLVVFATHRRVIDHLMNTFPDIAVKVDGSVSGKDRQDAVDAFQHDDKIQLFVGNIKAAGVGLTLTAASNVAFLEFPWTPGELNQAEDRLHRIGQKNAVNVHYLLAQDTIEEKIASLLDSKRKVLDSVLDGEVTNEKSLITELINKFTNNDNN